MSKQWETVLYPPFLDTISGEYYSVISDAELRCELYNLAKRAIAAFKFPKVSLKYAVTFTKHEVDYTGNDVETEVGEGGDWTDVHAYFLDDAVSYNEIEIIIAWMKVYWAENQVSNADNFLEVYTDSNIKTYSRANALDKFLKFVTTFRKEARDLETRYSRVTSTGKPSIGFEQ